MKYRILIGIILSSLLFSFTQEEQTDKKYLLGQVVPSQDSNFVHVSTSYTHKTNLYLEKETYEAFVKMQKEAWKEGINFNIISGFRSFNYQKSIWESKWTGTRKVNGKNLKTSIKDPALRAKTILHYSAMPGTSRHHWGTDIDIYSLNNNAFASDKGLKIYNWLKQNASRFGFCQVYSRIGNSRETGYNEEKWHWSYLPKSATYLSDYMNTIKYSDITNFKGSETSEGLNIIQDYVFSINTKCY